MSTRSHSSSYKIAIVGSGPAGCYTAKYLRARYDRIDIIERLPTPYGLVRYGVAPDHPEVKNVQNDFADLFQHAPAVQFFGNVQVGKDVSVTELRQMYHAVVLAYGCESDQRLGLEGEDTLTGILSAREFVAWYNGHPDWVHIGDEVARALKVTKDNVKDEIRKANVVVIGQGNVALDCARILIKGSCQLLDTDIASHALPILGEGVEQVSIVGRRGVVQAAFTIKELRELTRLSGASFTVLQNELNQSMNEASQQELEAARYKQRIFELLSKTAAIKPTPGNLKNISLRFFLSPHSFEPDPDDPSALGSVVCERTVLSGEAGRQRATGTGEMERIPADLALVSIGYKAVSIPGIEDFFDNQRGIVRNEHGKVDDASEELGGLYVSGWLKRGPSGIIGTNIIDAKETVASMVHDLSHSRISDVKGNLETLLEERGVPVVSWDGYCKIDAKEKQEKRSANQPREKIVDIDLQLKIALSN